MNYLYGLILGLLESAGELLPLSGRGILQGIKAYSLLPKALLENSGLEVLLRMGALLAVVLVFHKAIWGMIAGFCSMIAGIFKGTFKWRKATRYQMMAAYLLLSTLPLLAAGLLRQAVDYMALLQGNLAFTGFMMLLSGGLLFLGDHSECKNWSVTDMKPSHSFKLGLFQAFATLPGVSRSGITLSMGMNMGFLREEALEFSFMMSLPFLGAELFRLEELSSLAKMDLGVAAAAFGAAVLGGIGAIFLMKWAVRKDRLSWMVGLCLLAGLAMIIMSII